MSHGHDDFENEPVPGLPKHLPAGEHILWQGAPAWKSLARYALHVRTLSIYASIMVLWRGVATVYDGGTIGEGLIAAGILAGVIGTAIAILAGIAYLYAKTTIYTVTNRRLVMRFGIALPITIQIPYTRIGGAGLRLHRDGSGDIPVEVNDKTRISYLILWPNVRPWRVGNPQPMLRNLKEPAKAAEILSGALLASLATEEPEVAAETARTPGVARPDRKTGRKSEQPGLFAGAAG